MRGTQWTATAAALALVALTSSAASSSSASSSGVTDRKLGTAAAASAHPRTMRANVGSHGRQASGGGRVLDISETGRYVLFRSASADVVPHDTNGVADVFVHDRVTGKTGRVDVGPGGLQANGAIAEGGDGAAEAVISSDGRYVAFTSRASNLRRPPRRDSNGTSDVYLRDRRTGQTRLISKSPQGTMFQAGFGASVRAITTHGGYVLFAHQGARQGCLYVRDRVHGATHLVGCQPWTYSIQGATVSDGGRYVAWSPDIYSSKVTDRKSGKTTQVPSGLGDALVSDMTPDAHYLVFSSDLSRKGRDYRILVWNRLTGAITDASVTPTGAPTHHSNWAAISRNGRYVLFSSDSPILVPGDTNSRRDLFLRDLHAKLTTRVSLRTDGSQIPEGIQQAVTSFWNRLAFSGDGRFAGFDSHGANVVPHDTNNATDGFLRGPLH